MIDWQLIFKDYEEGYSMNRLVKKYNLSFNTIRKTLIKSDVHIRTFKEAQINSVKQGTHVAPQKGKFREQHSSWKGGMSVYVNGKGGKRNMIYNGKKYIPYADYLIMQKYNMKVFPKGYCVHHEDEDTLNDNDENLKFMKLGKHTKLHNEERKKCCS